MYEPATGHDLRCLQSVSLISDLGTMISSNSAEAQEMNLKVVKMLKVIFHFLNS